MNFLERINSGGEIILEADNFTNDTNALMKKNLSFY